MAVTVSPHEFKFLLPWDLLHKNGRCFRCTLPKFAHPVDYWAPARSLGDKTKAKNIECPHCRAGIPRFDAGKDYSFILYAHQYPGTPGTIMPCLRKD